ncbi:uncharacterized protein B0H18DRAFT_1138662 [Fomitopsis serialis]|uniref:uncharacterized protein n=1 Tax=Fomitopsis serialis TaxID=139415 RepID=UPI002007854C|nr:uncharacterized protein B0H18DRAFT_1138662 [Neoantrodia serialis]KAH9916535.1 hypothetical protein B0H18DRAFT_1138662 [Neoantrodia serialis]
MRTACQCLCAGLDVSSCALVAPHVCETGLDGVTVQLAPLASAVQQPLHAVGWNLNSIFLFGDGERDYPVGTSDALRLHRSVVDLLCSYSTTVNLTLQMSQIFSFSEFEALLHAFPAFREVHLTGDPNLKWELPSPSFGDVPALLASGSTETMFDTGDRVYLLQVTSTFAARFFGLYAHRCRQLQQLHISFLNTSPPALQQSVQRLLRESGAVLKGFSWERHRDPEVSSLPQHSPDPMPPMVPHNGGRKSIRGPFQPFIAHHVLPS